jgi:hypothetical protein
MVKPRDYKKEYREYQGTKEQIKNRAGRNKARREMVKAGKAHKGDGKDVGHNDSNPRNNSKSNLKMESKKTNRGKRDKNGKTI